MIIIVKNAITGCVLGIAKTATEAREIAERKMQPYVYQVRLQ